MATKKAASTKKATAKKPAAAKTSVRTARADAPKPKTATVSAAIRGRSNANKLPENIVNIVFAELLGTFILTLVVLATYQESGALYAGLALTVIVMAVGAISGAHVNPAVTFGLWAMRRLKSILVPFYWGAQFLGAMLAVITINWVSNNALSLSFDKITNMDWAIFGAELVGSAVFLFGIAAVVCHRELSNGARALGIGLSLVAGVVAGTTLYTATRTAEVARYQSAYLATQQNQKAEAPKIPHVAYVKGVTINPAVALAVTDRTEGELNSSNGATTNKEKTTSRLSLEVILGTLIGAALGGNLYLLVAGRRND